MIKRIQIVLVHILPFFIFMIGCNAVDSSTKESNPSISIGSSSLSGNYTATVAGLQQTATFSRDTVTEYNELSGKKIFEYYLTAEPIE